MNEINGGKETYMTIEEVAAYLKLAAQTIRKYVLNKSIPYRKVQKSVRFRLSEIEKWIDEGGGGCRDYPVDVREGDLFAEAEAGETTEGTGADVETEAEAETGELTANETGAEGQTGGLQV
ncbi:MAG: helix-turn-helix domain-containing protein [Treponema sp.]|nr:helix-turn-helix domain-containing protein [Treponema sp.]